MFKFCDLEAFIVKSDDYVICPVKGCKSKLKKMDNKIKGKMNTYLVKGNGNQVELENYLCKIHNIFVSPTKIIYKNLQDNFLWYSEKDKKLIEKILK